MCKLQYILLPLLLLRKAQSPLLRFVVDLLYDVI